MSSFRWSKKLAYAVGLFATDGCLSKDGRHLDFTSKDIEQIENFKKCLNLQVKVGWKSSGFSGKIYPRLQFGNVKLFRWLESIGLHPNKSKTIGELKIPDKYFYDFLRGSHDGDGSFYSYWDPRWKSSFMYYLQLTSASRSHLEWIHDKNEQLIGVTGKIKKGTRAFVLVYAKMASKKIVSEFYRNDKCVCLMRKKIKIFEAIQKDK